MTTRHSVNDTLDNDNELKTNCLFNKKVNIVIRPFVMILFFLLSALPTGLM